ncbi:MAG: serine/threonine protein kinase, partial [Bacteroidetes bacterium]
FVWVLYRANRRKKRDNALLQTQKNEIQRINDDITASIAYAKRIQEAMLPTQTQLQHFLPEHFILFQPRDVVSGDFYWFQEKEGLLFLSAIDCTGHGVPGAFMSMMGDALLNQIVLDKALKHPDLILNEMHREIRKTLRQEDNENKDGMDLAIVVLDIAQKRLEFAGAHCPLVLIQDQKLHYVKGDRLSVGGFQPELERVFTRQTFSLDSPTVFYIFSDGYQDQFGGKDRRKFSIARFREMLLEIHNLPAKQQKDHLQIQINAWSKESNEKQIDDRLVIGVKVGYSI